MPTHYEKHNPKNVGLIDPDVFAIQTLSTNSAIALQTTTIEILGIGFSEEDWVTIYKNDEDPDGVEILPIEFESPFKIKVDWTPSETGDYKLIAATGTYTDSKPFFVKAIALPSTNATIEEMRSQSRILLNNPDLTTKTATLKNGKLVTTDLENDILLKSGINLQRNDKGGFLNGNGFIGFSALRWEREKESRTVEFIFNLKGDRSFYLGLAGVETFLWNKTDRLSCDLCYYFYRDRLYYHYGGKWRLASYPTYELLAKNKAYCLKITDNGDPKSLTELFVLPDSNPENWHKGELIWDNEVRPNIRGNSATLMPILLGANKPNNELIAVQTY